MESMSFDDLTKQVEADHPGWKAPEFSEECKKSARNAVFNAEELRALLRSRSKKKHNEELAYLAILKHNNPQETLNLIESDLFKSIKHILPRILYSYKYDYRDRNSVELKFGIVEEAWNSYTEGVTLSYKEMYNNPEWKSVALCFAKSCKWWFDNYRYNRDIPRECR